MNSNPGPQAQTQNVRLGLVATHEGAQRPLLGLAEAAVRRGWPCRCFLTGSGVRLLRSARLLELARAGAIRLDVCEHSWKLLEESPIPEGANGGSQYQNAELAHLCDRVVVF